MDSPLFKIFHDILNRRKETDLIEIQYQIETWSRKEWIHLFNEQPVNSSWIWHKLGVFYKSYNIILDGALQRNLLKGDEKGICEILNQVGYEKITVLVFHMLMPILTNYEKKEYTHFLMQCGKTVYDEYFINNYRKLNSNNKGIEKIYIKWDDYYFYDHDKVAAIGILLVDILIDNCDWIFKEVIKDNKNSTIYVAPMENVKDLFNDFILIGTKLPMIVQPKNWGGSDMEYGGYLLNGESYYKPLIHQSVHFFNHKSAIQEGNLYQVINRLQAVGFKINKPLLNLLVSLNWSDLVCNDIMNDKYYLERNILTMASLFENIDKFYIPLFMDWRGRIYTDTDYLTFQGTELARALLLFEKGTVLNRNDDGFLYFKIHGANCYGLNNLSFKDRIEWVNKNSNLIYTLDENFIKKAEAPILFLAFCLEYKNVLLSDGIYITHLPVQFDASCNGIQHLSSLITDTNLAKKVNIIEASFKDIPNDLYNECVKHIKDEIKNECLTKPEMSSLLKLDINRSFVKRTIMTIPYNVTYNGALNQIEDFFKKEWDNEKKMYTYEIKDKSKYGPIILKTKEINLLTKIIYKILFKMHPKLSELINYLTKMVQLLTDLKLSVDWITPSGLHIKQAYTKKKQIKVTNTFHRKKSITLTIPTNILDKQNQKRGIVPNLVHSLDGTILALTIIKSFKSPLISNIYTIHDCFASTAPNIPLMNDFIREAFIELYSNQKYIDTLHNFWIDYISHNYTIDAHGDIEIPNGTEYTYLTLPKKPIISTIDAIIIKNALYMVH